MQYLVILDLVFTALDCDTYMHRWTRLSSFQVMVVPCSEPSHYLNQWWLIVNWINQNKLQWKWTSNIIIFIRENAPENVWKIWVKLFRPQCVLKKYTLKIVVTYPRGIKELMVSMSFPDVAMSYGVVRPSTESSLQSLYQPHIQDRR